MMKIRVFCTIVGAGLAGLVAFACSSSASPAGDAGIDTDVSDVLYEGGATDEALEALVAAPVKTGKAPFISAPTAGQVLPKEAPFTFTWSEAKQAMLPRERTLLPATRNVRAPKLHLDLVLSLFEGTAHAHGTPINGQAYLLTFATEAEPKLVRVFTAKTTYVPSADAWNKLLAAKTTIQFRVRAATFEDNRLIESGGPFDSENVSFTVKP